MTNNSATPTDVLFEYISADYTLDASGILVPAGTHEVLVVATETAGTAQIGGYVVLKDNATNDTSFFFME